MRHTRELTEDVDVRVLESVSVDVACVALDDHQVSRVIRAILAHVTDDQSPTLVSQPEPRRQRRR